jgi:hypothetical protein
VDPTSALKTEVFRPLTTVIVPGALALGPFMLLAMHFMPALQAFWAASPIGVAVLLAILVLSAGLILENIGGYIELLWDALLNRKDPTRPDAWRQYLSLRIQDEFIGQRYLRTVHLRFKFELAMCPALLFFGAGLVWANGVFGFWQAPASVWIYLVVLTTFLFLLYESYNSACVLGTLHQLIIEAVAASPTAPASPPKRPPLEPVD